ncbi:hypothetical protein EMIT0373P_60173 [Pseudomonas chlororaphis]
MTRLVLGLDIPPVMPHETPAPGLRDAHCENARARRQSELLLQQPRPHGIGQHRARRGSRAGDRL